MQLFLTQLEQQIIQQLETEPGTFSLELTLPDSGEAVSVNPLRLSSASLIKVFIMAEAFRRSACGSLDLNQTAEVTPLVQVGGAGPLEYADLGTRVILTELIELMIVESDNTATNMLIDLLGTDAINILIQRLGCRDTLLGRRMMDFTARSAGCDNFTTARDMNRFFCKLYHHRCIDPASDEAMLAILCRQTDKCKLPVYLPSGTIIAHKTGELDGVEHDSGIIFAQPHYILTIMTDKLPDEAKGRDTIAKLSLLVYQHICQSKS